MIGTLFISKLQFGKVQQSDVCIMHLVVEIYSTIGHNKGKS